MIRSKRSKTLVKAAKIPAAESTAQDRIAQFDEVIALIEAARGRAYHAVNTELVSLYWQLGEYISKKIANAEWGDGVVERLAGELARRYPGQRGFTRPNLFRMRQFYEAYRANEKVSALLRQLPWTHHLIILSQARPEETREFYILLAIQERWSSRELERQIQTGAVLRSASTLKKVSPAVTQMHPAAVEAFKSAYSLEFLGLPGEHSEADLHGALLQNLGRFITELGRDFCFVGSQYPVQVGNRDFAIDLVFFHRTLQCLVAFELKVGRFEPEHLGKLAFYVEALDATTRNPMSARRSACSCARARMTRSWSLPWRGLSRRRSLRSIERCFPRRRSCARSCTNCTPWPRPKPRRQAKTTRMSHDHHHRGLRASAPGRHPGDGLRRQAARAGPRLRGSRTARARLRRHARRREGAAPRPRRHEAGLRSR